MANTSNNILCGENIITSNIITVLIVTLIFCNVADSIFTEQILQINGYVEANPISKYIIENYGYSILTAIKVFPLIALFIIRDNVRITFLSPMFILTYFFILLNVYQINTIISPIGI